MKLFHNFTKFDFQIDLIKKKKEKEKFILKSYLSSKGNVDEQERYASQFEEELTKHSEAEEQLIYPAFEQYLGNEGKQMADHDRNEHKLVCLIYFEFILILFGCF